jgi:hypothetical protein
VEELTHDAATAPPRKYWFGNLFIIWIGDAREAHVLRGAPLGGFLTRGRYTNNSRGAQNVARRLDNKFQHLDAFLHLNCYTLTELVNCVSMTSIFLLLSPLSEHKGNNNIAVREYNHCPDDVPNNCDDPSIAEI